MQVYPSQTTKTACTHVVRYVQLGVHAHVCGSMFVVNFMDAVT